MSDMEPPDTLPPGATFEDIQYHIYVQQAIRRGLEAAERGDLLEQDEVERRMAKWLGGLRWSQT